MVALWVALKAASKAVLRAGKWVALLAVLLAAAMDDDLDERWAV